MDRGGNIFSDFWTDYRKLQQAVVKKEEWEEVSRGNTRGEDFERRFREQE